MYTSHEQYLVPGTLMLSSMQVEIMTIQKYANKSNEENLPTHINTLLINSTDDMVLQACILGMII